MKKSISVLFIAMIIISIIFTACDNEPEPVEYTLTINATNGTVSVKVGGDNLTGSSPYTIEEGSSVSLTANPDDDYSFDEWSGDLTGNDNPISFMMNSDVSVTATFVEDTPTQYTLTTDVVGNGSITLNPSGGVYDEGTVVTVEAVADTGWSFDSWSGDLSGSDNPTTITIDGDKTITATFTINQYTLTTNVVGNGSITLDPTGGTYDYGTVVTVEAVADSGWSFDSWSGDLSGSDNPTTITIDGDKTITATFTLNQYTLTTNVVGNGSITLNPSGGVYDEGTVVTVEAVADSDWSFDSWSGDLTGSTNPTTITMNGDRSITATFTINQYTLNTNVTGNGSITLNPSGGVYDYGTVVTVEAIPDTGWAFDSWSGDLTGNNNPATITMDGDKSITATFTLNQYTLTTNVVGNGSITLDPTGGTYDYGTVVTVEAVADTGWSFDSWSGDLSGSDNPTTITIDGDKTITATFTINQYTLTTNVVGNGSITLDPSGGTYDYGTVVTVEALPDSIGYFENWSGDLSGNDNPTTITMDSNKNITANIVTVSYRDMVTVPEGSFTQEDTYGNSFIHNISAFEIGKYEVTYELWYVVRTWGESNGYYFSNQGREGNDGIDGASPTSSKYEPVTHINWRDAMVWCNAYSEMDGKTPVYYSDSSYTNVLKASSNDISIDTNPGSYDNPYVNDTAVGYRLPTEGQWQYSASYIDGTDWLPYNHASGDNSSYCHPLNGGTSTVFGDYAWYSGNSESFTHDVGTKLANHLKIHDMSGNVWEWCWDWRDDYPAGPETDYEGAVSGSDRVGRGGSWGSYAGGLRVGYRFIDRPYDEGSYVGFRVARRP